MPAITKKSIEKLRERIIALQVRNKDFVLSSGASGKHYIDITADKVSFCEKAIVNNNAPF